MVWQFARALLAILVLFLLALAGVWTAGRLSPGYTLDLGPEEWGRIQNANEWEAHGGYSYRWTRDVTRFRLPVLGTPRQLTLRLDGSRPAGVPPADVSLKLDGQTVATFLPPAGPCLYHIAYSGSSPWNWETVVELRTMTFQTESDPRQLGVVVDRMHFSPLVVPPGPQWALVALWTAVGLAAMALGKALGWSRPWAEVLAGMLVLALSALLVWKRAAALPWASLLLAVLLAGTATAAALRGRSREEERGHPSAEGQPGRFAFLCLGLALAVAALPILTIWFQGEGIWAVHMLEPFYPPAGPIPRPLLRWLPLAAVALVAVPAVNRELRLLGRWAWEAGRRMAPSMRPAGRWLLLGLLFVPLGYALRAQVLWGDGPSLISRVSAGYLFNEPEMLPFFVHGMLYRWTEQAWGWSVPDVFTLTSLVLGTLYVALAGALSDVLGRSRFEKAFVFGLLTTLATVQFGFGYLENYAFVTVALLSLFWRMSRCLQGRGSPAVVVALWVLACACHLQALLVGPAVLYTVGHVLVRTPSGAPRWRQAGMVLAAGIVPAALLMGLFVAGGYDPSHVLQGNWMRGNNPYTVVPLRSEETYTLFSLRHWANVVNEHVLVAPVVLPLLLLVVLGHGRRVPWCDPVVLALALSAAGLLLFSSTLYPDLSAAMDWDLFAVSALPYTLLTAFLFTRAVPEGRGKRYAATLLLVSAGAHVGTWVLLNAMML